MSYRLCIPVQLSQNDEIQREGILRQLKAAKTDTVFLVFERFLTDEEALRQGVETFKQNKAFFEENGFHVGAWLAPTIGYGGVSSRDGDAPNRYTHIVSDTGHVCPGAYCPLDEGFAEDFIRTVCALAQTGVGEIMFEDDYTLGGGKFTIKASGCLCERHRRILAERTGEDLTLPEIRERIRGGKANDYRSHFLDIQAETLLNFTRRIEKAVHAVNPKVRLGLSANASSYQIEGAPFGELVKATAGNTRPFVRMTGAPYWQQVPSLAANIEAIRLQCSFLEETGAELITEGDVYPRPRHYIPASFLEGYDMALRAAGGSHGILKYMTDYYSRPDYETGYFDRHIKNAPHYAEIEKRFSGKEAVGLNIAAYPSLLRVQEFGADVTADSLYNYSSCLPLVSQWFATDNSIPLTYGKAGDYPSLLFGDNARLFDLNALDAGTILDGTAARILHERGVDVGFESYEITPPFATEYYTEYKDFTVTRHNPDAKFYRFKLKEGAEVLSEHPIVGGGSLGNYSEHLWHSAPRASGVYRYENAMGQRFVVFPFVAETAWGKGVFMHGSFKGYYRQRQLVDGVAYVGKKPLPAVCPGHPFLYIVARKDADSMAVGIWNFFADEVINPVIQLDEAYDRADVYLKNGHLEGNKLILDEDIPPYGFVLFTVYRGKKQ